MTAFLVATLLALILGGALVVIWREQRAHFFPALAGALALAGLVAGYAWWVHHGHELTGDPGTLRLEVREIVEVAGSHRVSGVIENTSDTFGISAVPLQLQVEDCARQEGGTCQPLTSVERSLTIDIPPRETRAFSATFNTPSLPRGTVPAFRLEHGGPRTYRVVPR